MLGHASGGKQQQQMSSNSRFDINIDHSAVNQMVKFSVELIFTSEVPQFQQLYKTFYKVVKCREIVDGLAS